MDHLASDNDLTTLYDVERDLNILDNRILSYQQQPDDQSNSVSSNQINKSKKNQKKKIESKSKNNKKSLSKLQGLLVLQPSSVLSSGIEIADNHDTHKLPNLVVGRSSRQNDRITFNLAQDHHMWFHVQGLPGSHCLLLLEPGEDLTHEKIQYAADVASYFSKARDTSQVKMNINTQKIISKILRLTSF